jgi:hypothetical protein
MRALLAVLVLLFASSAASAVELTIVTTKGYVRFSVPDDWRVLHMQTKPPVSVAAFQVSNPADDGTPHSTNVAVSLFHVEHEQGRLAADGLGKLHGTATPELQGEWTIYSQVRLQQATKYTVVDAKRNIADAVVLIRFAWPTLPNNPPDYDKTMHAAMAAVQGSVTGGLGALPVRDGEVIRRPTP